MEEQVENIKKKLKSKPKSVVEPLTISTGTDLIDLACSGEVGKGLVTGHFYLFVGASAAGKTWLMKQVFAEAAHNKDFADYRLIEDKPERGDLMSIRRYFGQALEDRLEPPPVTKKNSVYTEDFYDNVDDAARMGVPFIYGLDSEDALQSEPEVKKFQQQKKVRRKNSRKAEDGDDAKPEKVAGDFGIAKAKKNSSGLRGAHNGLELTKSILIMIKQSRDNIDMYAKDKQTRSGGRALTFYASLELWFEMVRKIRKKVNGKDRVIGSILRIHTKKNRIWGRDRQIEIAFYPSFGIDNTGSNINYLIEEGVWQTRGKDEEAKVVIAPDFDFEGKKEKLIELIENANREAELTGMVNDCWQEIEEKCQVRRKSRY